MNIYRDPLKDPVPELASDLDWILQSGQASTEMLVEALAHEYYSPVYRLALAFLDEPGLARLAAAEVFTCAALKVYRYRSSSGVTAWLYPIVLEVLSNFRIPGGNHHNGSRSPSPPGFIASSWSGGGTRPQATGADFRLWQHLDTLQPREILPVILIGVLGCTPGEAARLLGISETAAFAAWEAARRKLYESRNAGQRISAAIDGNQAGDAEELDRQLSQSFHNRWPGRSLSRSELEDLSAEMAAEVERKGARQKSATYLKEIVLVGVIILVVFGLVMGANLLIPDQQVPFIPLGNW